MVFMEKVKITIETVLERHEVEVPANHYRKIKLRLFDMLLDDQKKQPIKETL